MTLNFNRSPFFNDYDEDKQFYRILFRPGFAVQTRELNQLQSILQNQISRFGDHVFENGSLVIPGSVKVNGDIDYVRIQEGSLVSSDDSVYEGARIENSAGMVGTIATLSRAEDGDPITFFFTFKTGGSFSQNETLTITFSDGSTTTEDVTVENASGALGKGTIVSVERGVYFINDEFVLVRPQSVIIEKYTPIEDIPGDISVGLLTEDVIVTPEEDETLLDNAQGTFNETAPGAHRFKLDPTLVLKSSLSNLEDYVEIARIVNGEIAREARESEYSVLGDTIARRTFEESGDYVIKNFNIGVEPHPTDDTKLRLEFEPGKAYIRGYRVNLTDTTRVDLDKARTTDNEEDVLVPLQFGDYIHVKTLFGHPEPFTEVKLYSDSILNFTNNAPDEPSTQIGTATVKAVSFDPIRSGAAGETVVRLHLFNFNFTGSNSVEDIGTFYSDVNSPAFAGEVEEASQDGSGLTVLQETTDQVSVYQIPFSEVETVTDSSFNFYKQYGSVVSGSSVTISTPEAVEQFRDEVTDFLVYVTNVVNGSTPASSIGNVGTPNGVSLSVDNKTATLDLSNFAINDNDEVEIYAVMFKSSGLIKTKTPVQNSTVTTSSSPGAVIDLGVADVFNIVSIQDGAGNDFTSFYQLDTGQRDNFYDISKLNLRPGFSAPTTALTVTFDFFNHSSGDFFTADSYDAIAYEDIPSYTSENGQTFRLANSIDFRPIANTSGNFTNSPVPYVPDSEGVLDFSFYLPRRDKICVDYEGEFFVVKGVPDLEPESPKRIDNAITLYDIRVNAYTFNTDDLVVEPVKHPRFRMKDIGRLEERIENLEYFTALSLVEQDAISREFIDKFKTGILVDSFTGHQVGNASEPTYRSAVDPQKGELRPEASTKAIPLADDGTGSNTRTTGPIVTLPYTETTLISQEKATKIERIQPFIKFTFDGTMELNPPADSWVSTRRVPDTTLDGGNEFTDAFRANQNSLGTVWGSWRTFWRGNTLLRTRTGERITRTESTEIERIGDRVVNRSAIPFIRSRVIEFAATGMKPQTDLIAFFDSVDVSEFCAPTGGNKGDQLTTDAIGSITGTFEIPNEDDNRFRTGTRLFELIDSRTNPSTDATATYSAQGILEDISTFFLSTTIVDVDSTNLAQTQTVRVRRPQRFGGGGRGGGTDPLAQSFVSELENGSFVTSIDLYFGPEAADNDFPVTVQIRNMENGFPGPEIAPFGTITKNASDLGNGSTDASVATRFAFPAPVYLEENEEYCFVVLTDSDVLTVWASEMGQTDVITGERVTRQPFLGSLFKSQNNRTWTPAQLEDLKFEINRASFDTNVTGQIVFENSVSANDSGTEADPYIKVLPLDPFVFTDGSDVIKVSHPNHSMIDGDTARFSATNSTDLAGIPEGEIFDTDLTVTTGPSGEPIKPDEYYVQVSTSANADAQLGGAAVNATQHVGFSFIHPVVETLALPGTSAGFEFRGTDKFTKSADSSFVNITIGEDNYLKTPKTSVESGDDSVFMRATLTSENDNLSPYIDTKRISLLATENRVNNLEDTDLVAETDEASARYFTKPVELVNPADELRVFFDGNRPSGTNIDVYYKVRPTGSGTPIDQQSWQEMSRVVYGAVTESDNVFNEYSYLENFGGDFNIFAIKIVMRSTNEARVPRIRDLRAIAIKD